MKHKLMKRSAVNLAAALIAGMAAGVAQAEITLNAGVRQSYQTNLNGSTIKADEKDDSYTGINASMVYYTSLDEARSLYFISNLGAQKTMFQQYDFLDSTGANLGLGLYKQLTPRWSTQFTGRGFMRDMEQKERDSNGWGTSAEIKHQLTRTLWIKGVADYEDSKANLNAYNYTGETLGVQAGLLPFKKTFLNLGYSHAKRDFDTATKFITTANAVFLDVSQRVWEKIYLSGSYAYMKNSSNIEGTSYNDSVVSLGISVSY